MVTRIEIFSKVEDTRAKVKKKKIKDLGFKIKNLYLADVYTIDKNLNKKDVALISSSLTNPVSQIAYVNNSETLDFTWAIEIGFLPGVTDNIANTTKEIIEDLLKQKFAQDEGVYTSQLLFIKGDLTEKDIKAISESLINLLIQRLSIKSFFQFRKDKGMDKIVPLVKLDKEIKVGDVNLNVNDNELIKIGKLGIENRDGSRRGPLALDLSYIKTIKKYFEKLGRKPTDIELESIAQTWSEHCKHTIFADPIDDIKEGLFKTYIKSATEKIREKRGKNDFCVSVFTDNSGAIEFDDKYLITHKVETHNSPSAFDPFGGAITGIVGVNRDTIGFGLGAKPIVNTYGYCFADPKTKRILYKDQKLSQKMLSPRRILDGVVDGVNSGGNCSGIPTPQGFVFFDQRYQGKPLVFVGTLGLIPKKTNGKKLFDKKAKPGDYIVMIGGRVGQDGIHGATFSSEALNSGSPATAVQIGDPITQKKLSDAIVKEARDLDLYNSITDNGAGGLSCSVAETAKESNGCKVYLEKVPLKYPGLEPWKIWISESQERMTLAVPKHKWEIFNELMRRRGVEATIIGEFTNSGKCIVDYKGETIMDVKMDFLHDGLLQRPMQTKETSSPKINLTLVPKNLNLKEVLLKMLSRLNISSFEFISMQYDHEVQGNSVLKPLQGKGRINSESSVIKPLLGSEKGVVLSQGFYPTYSDINPYDMAASSIDTAIRNVVAAGANFEKIALLDNFCWCSPNDPERLYQLKESAKACYDVALRYETPFISGKDSMFNDFKGFDEEGKEIKISIPPTLLISSIGIVDDVLKTISIDVKFPEDLIYVLGKTNDEMGGSEYLAMLCIAESGLMKNCIDSNVPVVNASKNKKLYKDFYKCVQKDLIASSISITRGGVAISLAKMAMAGQLGVDVTLEKLKGNFSRDDFGLFSESQGRIIVAVSPGNKTKFEQTMKGNDLSLVGKVTDEKFISVKGVEGKEVVKIKLEEALKAYRETFEGY
ncbi:MAG: phosphoribosylformylglycinamidine synthase subunit PurL [bacterium]|nr:phosphoribosylformylglycinamidine synthase subunit PurL [bacterium]